MILFTILSMILLLLTVVTVIAISVGGALTIVVFGDVIVCAVIIIWIMKRLIRRKK